MTNENSSIVAIFGSNVKTYRKRLKMTQEQLAEKMNVSIQMISNLERGNKAIKIENLIKLCEILGVSTDYILLGRGSKYNEVSLSNKIKSLSIVDQKMIELRIIRRMLLIIL